MNILGLIILPIIFIFNSFFIGKLFFRKYKTLFGNYSFLLGWLSFVSLIGIITVPLYFLPNYVNAYKTILIIMQVILVLIYLFNFKWWIISYYVNINKIITFFFIFLICTCFYLFFLFIKWDKNIIEIKNDSSIVKQYYLFDDFIINFLSYFSSNKKFFYWYSLPIFFIFLLSNTIMSITKIREKFNLKRFISTIFCSCLFSIIVFNNEQNFFNNYVHLYIVIFFTSNFLITNFKETNFKNNYLIFNFSLLYLVIISNSFFVYSLIIYFMFITMNYSFNRNFSFDYIINSFIYVILACAFSIIYNNSSIVFAIVISFFSIFIAIYYIFKKNDNYYNVIYKMDNFFVKKVKYIIVLLLFVEIITIVLLLTRGIYKYNIDAFKITFLYTKNDVYQKIFLYGYYVFYSLVSMISFIYFLWNFRNNKSYKNYLFNISSIIILFYNPLSISLVHYINMLYYVDNYVIFLIFFMTIYLILFRFSLKINCMKIKKNSLKINKSLEIKKIYSIILNCVYYSFSAILVFIPIAFTFV